VSFRESKPFRLIWVLLAILSAFTLGYTLNPHAGRKPGLRSMPPFMGRRMPPAPPGRFVPPYRR